MRFQLSVTRRPIVLKAKMKSRTTLSIRIKSRTVTIIDCQDSGVALELNLTKIISMIFQNKQLFNKLNRNLKQEFLEEVNCEIGMNNLSLIYTIFTFFFKWIYFY
jgi:hypothetical protein